MFMNSIFNDGIFDEIFGTAQGRNFTTSMMATDVKEYDKGYELDIDLPGCRKENVQAKLKDGYLTVSAEFKSEPQDKENGKYLRKERRAGSCTRSFYVGDALTQEDIRARFEDGVLKILVPKETEHPEIEDKHLISIE